MHSTLIQALIVGGQDNAKIATGTFASLASLVMPAIDVLNARSHRALLVPDDAAALYSLLHKDLLAAKRGWTPDAAQATVKSALDDRGRWTAPVWNFTVFLFDRLELVGNTNGVGATYLSPPVGQGLYVAGHDHALLLELALAAGLDRPFRQAVGKIPVSITIYDEVTADRAAALFSGTSVRKQPTARVPVFGHDVDVPDPWPEVALAVFKELGVPLETQQRQVGTKGPAILTLAAAQNMVAGVALGTSAAYRSRRAGRIITRAHGRDVDFAQVHVAAVEWLGWLFDTLTKQAFKQRSSVLRTPPVIAALGALGEPFYTGNAAAQGKARDIVESVNWWADERWIGIAGDAGADGHIAAGSAKRLIFNAYRALTDPGDPGYALIRQQSRQIAPETGLIAVGQARDFV